MRLPLYELVKEVEEHILKNGICKLCGKEFPRYHSQQLYCSKDWKEKFTTAHRIAYQREYRIRHPYKSKPKIKPLICAECGRQYMGHFNSKYCDNCIPWRYERYRSYMENECTLFRMQWTASTLPRSLRKIQRVPSATRSRTDCKKAWMRVV